MGEDMLELFQVLKINMIITYQTNQGSNYRK